MKVVSTGVGFQVKYSHQKISAGATDCPLFTYDLPHRSGGPPVSCKCPGQQQKDTGLFQVLKKNSKNRKQNVEFSLIYCLFFVRFYNQTPFKKRFVCIIRVLSCFTLLLLVTALLWSRFQLIVIRASGLFVLDSNLQTV